jgi:hypothetical protein
MEDRPSCPQPDRPLGLRDTLPVLRTPTGLVSFCLRYKLGNGEVRWCRDILNVFRQGQDPIVQRRLQCLCCSSMEFPSDVQVPCRIAHCRLRINQRHLCQLQVNHQTESPIDLKKQSCLPARKDLAKDRNVLES